MQTTMQPKMFYTGPCMQYDFGWMPVRISEIQELSRFPETFPVNFHTICSEIFGRMESCFIGPALGNVISYFLFKTSSCMYRTVH